MSCFFPDIDTLDQFTLNLDWHRYSVECGQCHQNQHFVSHGFVYQKQCLGEPRKVGKRLFCSNRCGRSGCGATLRLYLAETLPTFRYDTLHLQAFLLTLIAGTCIQQAYQSATGCLDPRNAYRWLHKLARRLPAFRSLLTLFSLPSDDAFTPRAKRLRLLLPTVQALFSSIGPCATYQEKLQAPFI